jgi:phospholipase C
VWINSAASCCSTLVHPRVTRLSLSTNTIPSDLAAHTSRSQASADHVSILKFIERNWRLNPVTHRSRDNFPNPITDDENPYVPLNSPAIGDLFDLFQFNSGHGH